MDVQFHIGMIKANGVSSSSSLNVGTTILIGFNSNSKTTVGNGQSMGDHAAMPTLFNLVDDRDETDTPAWFVGPDSHTVSGPLGGAPFQFPPL